MITLIGFRWKHSNVLSREVLIGRFLLGNVSVALFLNSSKPVYWLNALFWWFDAVDTPLPIPNREVKRRSTDDTRKGKVGNCRNRALNKRKRLYR